MKLWPPNDVPPCPPLTGGMIILVEGFSKRPYLVIGLSRKNDKFSLIPIEDCGLMINNPIYTQDDQLLHGDHTSVYKIQSIWGSSKEYYKDNP